MTGIADGFFPRIRGVGEQPAVRALVRLLLLTSLCCGQTAFAFQMQSGSASPLDEPAIYRLQGTVVNSVTGEPVYRALVMIHAQQPRAVLTDRDGHFVIDGLPHLQTAITAQKPGFFDGQDWQRAQNQALIEVGPSTDPVLLKLIPEAIIVGHVSDEYGEPLERAPVRLSSFRIVNGRKEWQQGPSAATNEDGEYRIANLQHGQYYVSAGPARTRNLLQVGVPSSDPSYPLTYYPDASEVLASSPVQLSPGDQAQVDFALKPTRGFLVSGTVTGAPESSNISVSFMNQSGDDPASARVFNPRNGKFEARIAGAGLCTIKGRSQDAAANVFSGQITINVTSDTKDVVLRLAPTSDIPVTVQQVKVASAPSQGRGALFVTSGPRSSGLPLNVRIMSLSRVGSQMSYAQPRGPEDPSLHIPNLEPGNYQVEADAYQPWYIHSMTSGTIDLLREPFIVAAGEAQGIDIVMRDDVGSLHGQVHYSGDQKAATLLIIPDRAPQHPKVIRLGERGTFDMSLAPGDYKVFAFDSAEELEYMNPEVMGAYLSKATTVSVLPEQKATVDVELIRIQQP